MLVGRRSPLSDRTAPARRTFGLLLKEWRRLRRKSQLAVALEADVSPRHLSFVESGRSVPSRDMVQRLAEALDVPLRERNALLVAAGYAPMYPEGALESLGAGPGAPRVDPASRSSGAIPGRRVGPAVEHAPDESSRAQAVRPFRGARVADPGTCCGRCSIPRDSGPGSPTGTWSPRHWCSGSFVRRSAECPTAGCCRCWRSCEPIRDRPLQARYRPGELPFFPVEFRKDALRLSFFSMVTTVGAPLDITAQELRIEAFFPADDETERFARDCLGAD